MNHGNEMFLSSQEREIKELPNGWEGDTDE
jgi:hypothetical protein